jgi:SAM-dependent methyltransferase
MAVVGEVAAVSAAYGRAMPTEQTTKAKAAARAMWALGDYHRFATQLVWEVGPVVVEAAGIRRGMRVLDVAAGTGNVAVRAAEAGAEVVASDLTPENLAAGRAAAVARGIELEWVEADAEALPFADGAFDVVTSAFGVMFAPDHRAAARELLRVCRPGGTIALANFVPDGVAGDFFTTLGRHAPPPEGEPPLLWGTEEHLRDLLGDAVPALHCERRSYTERVAGGPADYVAFFGKTFGPLIALRTMLADDPERLAALDRDLLAFARRANTGPSEGPVACPYDYLLAVARLEGTPET